MLTVTPALIRACYAALRETLPFRRWKLPEANDVTFATLRTRNMLGDYTFDSSAARPHTIRASGAKHSRMETLLATIGHEMCHMRLEVSGCKERGEHGPAFKRLAALCCKHHPMFDPVTF